MRRGQTNVGVLGSNNSSRKLIVVDARLDGFSSWVRASVLVHELQHAADDAAGTLDTSSSGCYLAEERAFRTEAHVWNDLWQTYLPPNIDSIHAELNDITLSVFRDPVGFASSLLQTYQVECGG